MSSKALLLVLPQICDSFCAAEWVFWQRTIASLLEQRSRQIFKEMSSLLRSGQADGGHMKILACITMKVPICGEV